MSQSHHPTDTQVLLQSMLQRLELQPGRENQAFLQTPGSVAAASTQAQDVGTGAPNLQQVNSPVNVFGFNDELQRSFTSVPSQNVHTDRDTGESRVVQQAAWRGVSPGSGQLFPAQPRKDNDLTSIGRTDKDRVGFGGFAVKRHMPPDQLSGTRPNQVQGFTPKNFLWSMKSTDADTAGQNVNFHVGNGGGGSLEQSKETQIVSDSQNTTNSKRKQRLSENKTRRWTQKIKERWKDRQGNFGKKGKEEEEGTADRMTGQGMQISPSQQPLATESLMNTLDIDGAQVSGGCSEMVPAQREDNFFDSSFRSTSDSEIGLGSFSLLEEIVKGQEWAKFINPNFPTKSINQTPSKETLNQYKIQPNSSQTPGIVNQLGAGSNHWSFRSTEATPGTMFSGPPQAFTPASVDMTGGNQQQCVYRLSEPSEPMEDSFKQPGVRPPETGPRLLLRPSSFAVPAHYSSVGKSRVLTRKRQHQSAGRRLETEKISDGKEADRGSISSQSPTNYDVMDESGETQPDNVIPLYARNLHPSPLPSSPPKPFAPAPRGVLKHSVSHEPESSMETMTKRRRVEENRRVHFSEDVETISSPDLDLEALDSEEDSGSGVEEDSVTELECEVEQAVTVEAAPVRRTTLPAWILALKRKNTGRKHR